jgi:glutamate carboxypeptidase
MALLPVGLPVSLSIGKHAQHGRLRDNRTVNRGRAEHLGEAGLAFGDLHLNAKLVARAHLFAEFRFLHRRQQHQFGVPVGDAAQHQDTRHLRHRLYDEHARHHRKIGEMPREKRLIDGDILDADDALRLQFLDAVHQQHRKAVRENVADRLDIQRGYGGWHEQSGYYGFVIIASVDLILRYARQKQNGIIALIRELVEHESPSGHAASVNRFVEVLIERSRGMARVRTFPGDSFGKHVRLEFALPGRKKDGQILALGHSDTVWPLGTLTSMPYRRARGRLWGPGVFDMKAGLAFFLFAMQALRDLDVPVTRQVVLQVNSDEEVGSPSSRACTEDAARGSTAVVVLEPGAGLEGKLKTARKGVGDYTIAIRGRAAHAGLDFSNGASAIVEMARQIERVSTFTRLDRGITVSPGVISGGTRSNVVAAECRAEVDIRVPREADRKYLERKFASLRPFDKRCVVKVTGGLNRPPMERSAGIRKLFRLAQRLARELGVELEESSSGGGSDGNFTAALGVPTLDGLGAVGAGAHAPHESILVSRIADRTALLAKLIAAL